MKALRAIFSSLCMAALALLIAQNASLNCIECELEARNIIHPESHTCEEHAIEATDLPADHCCAFHAVQEAVQPTRTAGLNPLAGSTALLSSVVQRPEPAVVFPPPVVIDPSPPNGAFNPALSIIRLC